MAGTGPFETMMTELHDGLDRLFLEHRRALLDRDVARARAWLDRFSAALRAHAQDEEDHVLPAYAQHGGDDTDSPSRQFTTEHRKMFAFLDELDGRMAELEEPPDDSALLELLDRESWFKNLMTHHDLRERRVLYPKLAGQLSAAEQTALLDRLTLRTVVVTISTRSNR